MRIFPIQTKGISSSYFKKSENAYKTKQFYCPYNQDSFSKNSSNISFCAINSERYFDAKSFLQNLSHENAQKKYYFSRQIDGKVGHYSEILPNIDAIESLKVLDELNEIQKRQFIREFCSMTGFPDFKRVTDNIEQEIFASIYNLANKEDFDVKFIGYDSNCSVGRQLPIPGSDCDGLFMIIDPKEHKEPWYSGKIRWNFKDYVNQRVLSTPANHLPEVLSTDFIEQGLIMAQSAFKKCNFSETDLKRFEENLDDDTNDFVKSAEFNILMAQKVPNGIFNRDLYYKTAMVAEILRDGVVCENDFSAELYDKIVNSPLYKYSNLMKQNGLKHSLKSKYIARQNLANDFKQMNIEEQFRLIKDIMYFSLGKIQDDENKKYFSNVTSGTVNEMGNIEKMYDLIMNLPCDVEF